MSLFISLQSSYAGAYLEDKLNFYNRHMEKYGQFAGNITKRYLQSSAYTLYLISRQISIVPATVQMVPV